MNLFGSLQLKGRQRSHCQCRRRIEAKEAANMARITKSMGGVFIDSGPITATSRLEEVPEKNWYNLMCQRAMFVKAHLPHDCRCLVQFVADAERMYGPLGFKGADDFIARGLKLVPEEIRIAVEWLKISKPQEAVAYECV